MMDYYIDVVLKPDVEMRENVLLNRVYTKLHKVLCDLRSTDIGISFPDYKVKLGRRLRIHGSKERLASLLNMNWLHELSVYCNISDITRIPNDKVKYRTISRQQTNMTAAKLRRLIKRQGLSERQIKDYRAKMFSEGGLSLPYLELESASTGQRYRHFICFGELLDKSEQGGFNQFGLSKSATIPWF